MSRFETEPTTTAKTAKKKATKDAETIDGEATELEPVETKMPKNDGKLEKVLNYFDPAADGSVIGQSPQSLNFDEQALRQRWMAALNKLNKSGGVLKSTPPAELKSLLMRCVSLGLVADGREAALVPFGKETSLLIMADGFYKLAAAVGISVVSLNLVFEGEKFELENTNHGAEIRHTIDPKIDRNKSDDLIGGYAILTNARWHNARRMGCAIGNHKGKIKIARQGLGRMVWRDGQKNGSKTRLKTNCAFAKCQ